MNQLESKVICIYSLMSARPVIFFARLEIQRYVTYKPARGYQHKFGHPTCKRP